MPEITSSRYRVDATWADVPHLTEKSKREMLSGYPRHQRDARSAGIPKLGVGAIYTMPWDIITERPFQIPAWFPRGYALDVGWNRTACLWGAWDRENDVLHITAEHYVSEERPVFHATAIRARGDWMQGCIDPASRGRNQDDGKQLLAQYRQHGLKLVIADNSVESGILAVQERLETGRLKFFVNLRHTEHEYHRYHREEEEGGRSKIVKVEDHLMDALRYMVAGFRKYFTTRPVEKSFFNARPAIADPVAGY